MGQRYRILHPLESGPDIRVYSVADTWKKGAEGVLTLLPLDLSREEEREWLEKAYSLRLSLEHRDLVRVYDLAFRGSRVGIVSERLPGNSWNVQPPASHWRKALPLALRICYLIGYLHSRRFYLSVLKPSQFRIGRGESLKANLLLPFRNRSALSASLLRYAAPEVLSGQEPTVRGDIYSLGMLLYALLTGEEPYAGEDVTALTRKIRLASPRTPRSINPDLPSELEDLILEMTARDAGARPRSVEYATVVLERLAGHSIQAPVPRFRSELVGRDREIQVLREWWQEASRSGQGRWAVIKGASGIGKTALLSRLAILASIDGALVYPVSHRPSSSADESFQLETRSSGRDSTTRQIAQELQTRVGEGSKPVLFCIDDLQWMDEASLRVYREIMTGGLNFIFAATVRTDLPGGFWEELREQLQGSGLLSDLWLEPLSEEETVVLMRRLLQGAPSRALSKQLLRYCSGNPLNTYEVLRLLRDRGELVFDARSWKWRKKGTTTPVPPTIRLGTTDRIRALDGFSKLLLHYLSVFSKPVSLEFLCEMVGEPVDRIEEGLALLLSRDFLLRSGSLKDPVYAVSHDWLAEVVRGTLTARQHKRIHASIAFCLEKKYQGSRDPLVGCALMGSLLAAGDVRGARAWLTRVLRETREAQLYREGAVVARNSWKKLGLDSLDAEQAGLCCELLYLSGAFADCARFARNYLATHPECPQDVRLRSVLLTVRSDLLRGHTKSAMTLVQQALTETSGGCPRELAEELTAELLNSLCRQGELSSARRLVAELEAWLVTADKEEYKERIQTALCSFYYTIGDIENATILQAASVETILGQGRDMSLLGRVNNLGSFRLELGDFYRGDKLISWTLKRAEETTNLEVALYSKSLLALLARKRGLHADTMRELEELVHLNLRLNRNRHVEVELYIELAKNANYRLLPERALEYISKAQQVLARHPVHTSKADAVLTGAWSHILLGQPERALRAVARLDPARIPRERARFYALQAAAFLYSGRPNQAWPLAARALRNTPASRWYHRAKVRLLQVDILLVEGRVRQATRCLEEATALSRDHFYSTLRARSELARARCLALGSEGHRAQIHCRWALQMCRAIERPLLKSRILSQLGRLESSAGQGERALQHFNESVRILKERALRLSAVHRDRFVRQWIQPIEKERERLLPQGAPRAPHRLLRIRSFASQLVGQDDPLGVVRHTLEFLKQSEPGIAANFWFSPSAMEQFEVVASLGRCLRSGAQFLPRLSDGASSREEEEKGLPLSLEVGGRLAGLLYVESPRQHFSEEEIEFLDCTAGITRLQLSHCSSIRRRHASQPLKFGKKNGIVGEHPSMKRVFEEVNRFAGTDATVLVYGETGTGKELVARAIHGLSSRRKGRFVAVNCSALPESMVESELFGHKRGAFTGAVSDKAGLFEAASGGTLFLDEISTMPLVLQARLLRVLQQRSIRRLGETQERKIDVRVVAASNLPLHELVQSGEFRLDLYHRVDVCRIELPPLRDRASDIPLLVDHILANLNREDGRHRTITREARERLMCYSFPGNVRELRNILESAYHFSVGESITLSDIERRLKRGHTGQDDPPGAVARSLIEDLSSGRADFWSDVRDPFLSRDISRQTVRQIIQHGLKVCHGNYREVARYYHLPSPDYKRFLSFLGHHDCKIDFRPFRKHALSGGR